MLANDSHIVGLTRFTGERPGKSLSVNAIQLWQMRDGKLAGLRGAVRGPGGLGRVLVVISWEGEPSCQDVVVKVVLRGAESIERSVAAGRAF